MAALSLASVVWEPRLVTRRTVVWLAIAVSAAAFGGCGDAEQASTRTTEQPPRTRFATTTVTGLSVSPQETYEQAKGVCGLKHAREIAADFNMTTADHEAIAQRYARGYREVLREPAAVGCREGLDTYAKAHPDEKPRPPDRAEIAQRFYLRIDDYAIKLQESIEAAQDGGAGARSAILRVRDQIAAAAAAYRRDVGTRSAGARALARAANRAVAAIDARDPRVLVAARVAASEARNRFAAEALRP